MIDLPSNGDLVKVWPFPGRVVQHSHRTLDIGGGGRMLSPDGEEVEWDDFRLYQLKCGDILLHAPPESKDAEKPKAPRKFDPVAAAKARHDALVADEKAEAEKKSADAAPKLKDARTEAGKKTGSKDEG